MSLGPMTKPSAYTLWMPPPPQRQPLPTTRPAITAQPSTGRLAGKKGEENEKAKGAVARARGAAPNSLSNKISVSV